MWLSSESVEPTPSSTEASEFSGSPSPGLSDDSSSVAPVSSPDSVESGSPSPEPQDSFQPSPSPSEVVPVPGGTSDPIDVFSYSDEILMQLEILNVGVAILVVAVIVSMFALLKR